MITEIARELQATMTKDEIEILKKQEQGLIDIINKDDNILKERLTAFFKKLGTLFRT